MTTLDTLRQLQAEITPGVWEYDEASEYVWAGEDNILWNTTEIHTNGHLAAAAPAHLADLITAL